MAGLGFIVTLIDLLMRTSRVQDVLIPGLHAPLIVVIIGSALLLFSGRLFEALFSKVGRYMALLTVIMFLSVGVSVWPGGAYQHMLDQWIPVLPTFVFICGFVRTFRQLKTAVVTAACGFGMVSYLGVFQSAETAIGRTGLEGMAFGNLNDLAMIVLFGLPLGVWVILDRRVNGLVRLFLAGGLICSVPVFFGTGSRAGLLALVGIGLYALFRLRMETRIRIIAVAAVALPVGLAMAPSRVIDRYMTILSSFGAPADPIANPSQEGERKVDQAAVLSAAASTDSRLELLKRSIIVTFENPVLGVGPGMFVVAENEIAVSEGKRRGHWKASHNMYTQMSSEIGLPGAFVFVYLIVIVWRSLSRAEKAHPAAFQFAREIRHMAFCLKLSMLVFALCGLTLSMGYSVLLPMLCGFTFVMDRLLASARVASKTVEASQEGEAHPAAAAPAFARVPAPITRG